MLIMCIALSTEIYSLKKKSKYETIHHLCFSGFFMKQKHKTNDCHPETHPGEWRVPRVAPLNTCPYDTEKTLVKVNKVFIKLRNRTRLSDIFDTTQSYDCRQTQTEIAKATANRLWGSYNAKWGVAYIRKIGRPRVATPVRDCYIRLHYLGDRFQVATTTASYIPGVRRISDQCSITVWHSVCVRRNVLSQWHRVERLDGAVHTV